MRQQIDDGVLLSVGESQALRSEILDAEVRHHEEIDRLNEQLSRAKADYQTILKRVPSAQPVVQADEKTDLTASQIDLLGKLSSAGGEMTMESIASYSGADRVQRQFDIGS